MPVNEWNVDQNAGQNVVKNGDQNGVQNGECSLSGPSNEEAALNLDKESVVDVPESNEDISIDYRKITIYKGTKTLAKATK